MSISVCMVDDHELVRSGISLILNQTDDISLTNQYSCLDDCLPVLKLAKWDVLLLDISLSDMNGLDGIRLVKETSPDLPILILTMHAESQFGIRAMQLGANGYLTKDKASTDLLTAIRTVVSGKKYIGKEFSEMIAMNMFGDNNIVPHERLSNREFDVMLLLAKGESPTNIAQSLDLSIKTVSTYRARILDKLQLNNNAELIRYCLNHELVFF